MSVATADDFETSIAGLRVALVHDWLTGMRGGEKVLEEIASLVPEAPIYTLFHFRDQISDAINRHPVRTSPLQRLPEGWLRRRYRWLLPLFPWAMSRLDLDAYDLVISTSHCVAKSVRTAPGALHLCYCHTPMRYAWDQRGEYFPGWKGLLAAPVLAALRAWDRRTASRVDVFWANSEFVRDRIQRYYGRDAVVLAPPVDVDRFAPSSLPTSSPPPSVAANATDAGPADDVVACDAKAQSNARSKDPLLTVSALVPYKRVDLAVRACRRLGQRLRVVGKGSEHGRLQRLAGPTTELLGHVDASRLEELMRGARLFLQPGVEDFGISSVEALAAGTPVVARGRGGVRDIVVDGVHGVLYDETEGGDHVDDLAAAIDRALKIRFNPLELLRRARTFSRDRFIDELKASIAKVLAAYQPRAVRRMGDR